jgi:rhamnosyltransferase
MVYFDRFILGSLIPVGNLAFYTTPYEIVTRVLILPSAVARVLFPTFSSALAVNRNEEAILHSESIRLLSLILLPISSFLILFAEPGLHLWLGNKFSDESTLILQIFAVGIFFNGIANIPYTLIQSANRPDLTAKIHLFEFPIYIATLWFMTTQFGILGAATAWSMRLAFDFYLLDSFAKKLIKVPNSSAVHLLQLSFILWLSFLLGQVGKAPLSYPIIGWGTVLLVVWIFFLSPREKRILLGSKLITLPEETTLNHNEKCMAIIVSFNPSDYLIEFSERLLKQFDEVLIVDNKSNEESKKILAKIENLGCKIIYNKDNLGIASALNQGFKYAGDKYNWVCTFDQDSNIDLDYREKLFSNLNSHFDRKSVAVVGPKIFEVQLKTGIAYTWIKNSAIFEVPTVITSGSLIRVKAHQAVGGFNEGLFIDYVDHEFALKLRSKGFLVTQSSNARLFHKLGNSKAHRLLFREFYSTHHDALRRYYNTRNRFYVYFKFLVFEPIWVVQDFYHFIKETFKILLVEKDKMAKLKGIYLGLFDCVYRRFGQRKTL